MDWSGRAGRQGQSWLLQQLAGRAVIASGHVTPPQRPGTPSAVAVPLPCLPSIGSISAFLCGCTLSYPPPCSGAQTLNDGVSWLDAVDVA